MRTHRSLSAALTLTMALALTACDGGEEDIATPAGPTSAAPTEEQAGATATDDVAVTAADTPTQDPDDDSEDTAGQDGADATEEATEPDDDTDDDGEDDDGDGVVAGGPAADLTPSALAALETALAEVEGTAYEVDDREDGFWEVDVMTTDGATEVTVGPDGTTVDGMADDTDDALEDAGRQALAAAQVTLAEAVVAAVRAAEGQLDSAELAQVDDVWWWRVVVDSPDQEDIELRVDPATGEVVASEG